MNHLVESENHLVEPENHLVEPENHIVELVESRKPGEPRD